MPNQSTGRILTTHTGSLPRPQHLQGLLYAQEQEPGSIEPSLLAQQAQVAVTEVVHKQLRTGLDFINDGEMSKSSYVTYASARLSGFHGSGPGVNFPTMAGLWEFPEFASRMMAEVEPLMRIRFPSCSGPITYIGRDHLNRDIENLKVALREEKPAEPAGVFMTAASPGVIAAWLHNEYYPSHEAYVSALAEAMKQEYDAIVGAGFLLQVDCPDLSYSDGDQADEKQRALHVEALNHATRDIPSERMRMHICWGNYEAPHTHDIELRKIMGTILRARPATLVLEAANPRHGHEWQLFEEVKLPEDKMLVLGVIDTTTNIVEHPDLVAQRLKRVVRLVGPERLCAGTDCGFATFAGFHPVDPQVAWAKLASMVEGARLASQHLSRV